MRQVWYHGTHLEHLESIEQDGLRVSQDGIWGVGVYLTDSLEDARGYGNTVLVFELEDLFLPFDYERDMRIFFPYLSFEEEEAEPLLGFYCKERKFAGFSMRYKDGTCHLVVLDPGLLTISSVIFHRAGGDEDGANDREPDGRTAAAGPQLETSGPE